MIFSVYFLSVCRNTFQISRCLFCCWWMIHKLKFNMIFSTHFLPSCRNAFERRRLWQIEGMVLAVLCVIFLIVDRFPIILFFLSALSFLSAIPHGQELIKSSQVSWASFILHCKFAFTDILIYFLLQIDTTHCTSSSLCCNAAVQELM